MTRLLPTPKTKVLSGMFAAIMIASSPAAYSAAFSISDLIAGGEIVADGLRYYNWWASDFSSINVTPDFNKITVTPVPAEHGMHNPGLRWDGNGEFTTGSSTETQIVNILFQFAVEALPCCATSIFGMEIAADANASFSGRSYGDIFSAAYEDDTYTYPDGAIADLYIFPGSPTDRGMFTPRDTVWVDALVYVGSDPEGSADLAGGFQRFYLVPEPASALLFGIGIAAVGWTSRRQQSWQTGT